mgnify:CR=1 FL=1
MKTVYCVEDDNNIRELVCYTLTQTGSTAVGFADAESFFAAVAERLPDLVLLDIMLPDKDGMEILHELRSNARTERLPIIMVTAKSGQIDKIKGLDGGADDYITKPFDIMELISRVNALLRRVAPETSDLITYKKMTLALSERTVAVSGKPVTLTYKEFEILRLLAENRGKVLTRDTLMNRVWGTEFEGESRTVDVHIRTLRQKLGEAAEYIETVRNVGYKLS